MSIIFFKTQQCYVNYVLQARVQQCSFNVLISFRKSLKYIYVFNIYIQLIFVNINFMF